MENNEKKTNKNKTKMILLGLALCLGFPIVMLLSNSGVFQNDTIWMIFSTISSISLFVGFCIIGFTLVDNGSGKKKMFVNGIEVRNDYKKKYNEEKEEKKKQLKLNVLISFFKSSIALAFTIVSFVLAMEMPETEKVVVYIFSIFVSIIILLPTLYHLIRYVKFIRSSTSI